MTQNIFYSRLENRGLIQIEGADKHNFLQSLITNDINKCTPDSLLYACLLNAQGKFLHDFFILHADGVLMLDCEGGARAQDLFKRLNMYRLRADVQISMEETHEVYAIIGAAYGMADPRHPDMGYRSVTKPDNTIPEQPFSAWDTHRIALNIPDGSRDLIVGKSTMDEAHMDALNAVDYNKGCYVGQEITARMHYRGLGKKHLQTVKLNALPDGAALRSSCGDIGIALVRD